MLDHINIHKVLFLDIETVSQFENFDDLDNSWKKLWGKKSSFIAKEDETPEDIYSRAAIYAEFGRIICISVGFLNPLKNSKNEFRVRSFYGDDEKQLLSEFSELLTKHYNHADYLLCAHNGKEFDFPYLSRRMLINNIPIPSLLDTAGRKPWEVQHLDTLQLWKFGDYKHYTSLELLTKLFDIESPKEDIDGSQINEVYFKDNDLERIKNYCENDVVAVAQLLLKYKGLPSLDSKQINRIKS